MGVKAHDSSRVGASQLTAALAPPSMTRAAWKQLQTLGSF